MTHITSTVPDQSELRNVKMLTALALIAALVAALAGIVLLTTSPESGSTAEGALGLTAAIAGLSTAGFAIAAAVYAQVKNLWQYAPAWVRVAAWVLIGFAVATAIWGWIN